MSIEKRLRAGLEAQQRGRIQAAFDAFKSVLKDDPENADALHFIGLILYRAGEEERGINALRKSLNVNPMNPHAQCNLGNMLLEQRRPQEAAAAYQAALAYDPDHIETRRNFGVLLRRIGKLEEAIEVLEAAARLDPDSTEVWHNLGLSYMQVEDFEKAADAFERCVNAGLNPQLNAVWHGRMLIAMMRHEAAIAHFERYLEKNPDDVIARHHLDALHMASVDAVPQDYVRTHFDSFSKTFNEVLEGLDYRAPRTVAERVSDLAEGRGPFATVVDLGCGTGLCGPLVAEHCDKLIGVDLSPGMLSHAAATGAYQELYEGELVQFLLDQPEGSVDLAISADTLNYLGDLTPLMGAVSHAFAPGAVLIGTFEDAGEARPARGYRLEPHGRFCHSRDYLHEVISSANLEIIDERVDVLRREAGESVSGLILTIAKTG